MVSHESNGKFLSGDVWERTKASMNSGPIKATGVGMRTRAKSVRPQDVSGNRAAAATAHSCKPGGNGTPIPDVRAARRLNTRPG